MRANRDPVGYLVVVWAAASAGEARAESKVHATASVTAGLSTNPLGAPRDPPPGVDGPKTVAFVDLRPGLVGSFATPRTTSRIRIEQSTTMFAGHAEATAYTAGVDAATFVALSRRATIAARLAVAQGRANTLAPLGTAAQTRLGVGRSGAVTYLAPTAGFSWSLEATPTWRVGQSLEGGAFTPIAGSTGVSTGQVDLRSSIDRVFVRDAVGAEARVGFAASDARLATGGELGAQAIAALVGRWRHDWGRRWSSQIDAGWVAADGLRGGSRAVSGPGGLAALRYTHEGGAADLSYTRTITPSLPIGQLLQGDAITAQGALPLDGASKLVMAASCGVQRNRVIDTVRGDLAGRIDVVLVDVALLYSPTAALALGARYQRFEQLGDVADARLGQLPFSRDIVGLTVGVAWPPLPSLAAPIALPMRVDRADGPRSSTPEVNVDAAPAGGEPGGESGAARE